MEPKNQPNPTPVLETARDHSASSVLLPPVVSKILSAAEVLQEKAQKQFLESKIALLGSQQEVTSEILAGNPAIGNVKIYRQVHDVADLHYKEEATVGLYQAAMLKKLLEEKPEHVFAEGRSVDLDRNNPSEYDAEDLLRLQKAFPDRNFPDDLSKLEFTQLLTLCDVGADTAYAYFHPAAKVHRAITPEDRERVYDELSKDPSRYEELIMHERERLAIAEVTAFLDKNPGATATLVYGAAHQWGQEDFRPDRRAGDQIPRLTATTWPGLRMAALDVDKLLEHSHGKPDLQRQILEKARHIGPLGFAALSTGELREEFLGSLSIGETFSVRCEVGAAMEKLVDDPHAQELLIRMCRYVPPGALKHIQSPELLEVALRKLTVTEEESGRLILYLHKASPELQAEIVKKAPFVKIFDLSLLSDPAAIKACQGKIRPSNEESMFIESAIVKSTSLPELQLELVQKCERVPALVFFSLKREDAKLAALDKLQFRADRPTEFEVNFLSIGASEKVRAEIARRWPIPAKVVE